jgi:hypothetical protein
MIFTLFGLIGCQSLWYQFLNIIVDIAPERFVIEEDHEKLSIPIVTSNPLNKNLPSLSSFEVIDRLIDVAVKRNPGIRRIIILGHSAGGQFVVRYAAINSRHELLEQQGVSIRYVVANSSSYPFVKSSPKSQHIWLEIPEVGHKATEIFTHPRFIKELMTLEF